jgi:hypothetical protein
VQVERSIDIVRALEEVFAFVADARNDPQWCPTVTSTVQTLGSGPGPGARYAVVHRPIPMRPAREMVMECVGWSPPHNIEWHENDGIDEVQVAYLLSDLGGSTRFTQSSFLRQAMPQRLRPVMRHGLGSDVERQLTLLKQLLERAAAEA